MTFPRHFLTNASLGTVFQNLQFLTVEFSFQNYLREQRILTRERNKECLREKKNHLKQNSISYIRNERLG